MVPQVCDFLHRTSLVRRYVASATGRKRVHFGLHPQLRLAACRLAGIDRVAAYLLQLLYKQGALRLGKVSNALEGADECSLVSPLYGLREGDAGLGVRQ
jgi:hypothetical protein